MMLRTLVAVSLVLGLAAGGLAAVAASPGKALPPVTFAAPVATPKVVVPEEQKKAEEVEALYKDGKYAEAIDVGTKLLAKIKDVDAKLIASKAVAESLRKKGEWLKAVGAYTRLRECYPKNSDEWALNDAISEVLRASPKGVYGAAADPAAKNLSDDGVLNEAILRLAGSRMADLKPVAAALRRGRTAKELIATFRPAAETSRRLAGLAPDVSMVAPHECGAAAGERLKEIGAQLVPVLKNKYETVVRPKLHSPASFTNVDDQEMAAANIQCRELIEAEKEFQECLALVTGGSWPEGANLVVASKERQQNYEQLQKLFVVRGHVWR
jgi:tetratricopeptide (TPR) repeat protein